MATPTDATSSSKPEKAPRAEVNVNPAGADLAALVHGELDAKAAAPAPGFLQADGPGLASPPAWQPTQTFWQKMTKKASRRVRPVHIILGVLGVALVAGAVVAGLLVFRKSAPKGVSTASVAVAAPVAAQGPTPQPGGQPAVTPPPATTSPEAAPPPSAQTVADSTPSAKVGGAKAKTRPGEERKKATTKETGKAASEEPAAAPAQPTVAAGRALTAEDIKAGVKQGTPAVAGCIKAARAKGELTPGAHTLTLDWVIAPSGAVTDAAVRGPTAVLSTSLPACFSQSMRQWRFPASPAGAPVKNFPFGPFTLK